MSDLQEPEDSPAQFLMIGPHRIVLRCHFINERKTGLDKEKIREGEKEKSDSVRIKPNLSNF